MKKIYTFLLLTISAFSLNAQTLWDNYEDVRKGTYDFISGSFIPYTENPDKTGANTSLVAAQYTRNPAETFDVLILDGQMGDLSDYLSGNKQMSIDVWSPVAGTTVQITLENSDLAQPANFPTGRHSVYLATTTMAGAWETLTFSFDNQPDPAVANDNVNRAVLLFAPNTNTGETYYMDNWNLPEFANDPCEGVMADPNALNDFECNQNTDFIFSHAGVNFRRIPNPDASGVNSSQYVASYIRNGGEESDVLIGRFDGDLTINADNTISIDVWDPNPPTTITFSLQATNNDLITELVGQTTMSETWETITFDPSNVVGVPNIGQFVILFDPGNFTADNYFFDNIRLNGTVGVADLTEVASFDAFPNPTSGLTNFQYELTQQSDVRISIFNVNGQMVKEAFNGTQSAGTHQIQWDAQNAAPGLYFYEVEVNGASKSGKLVVK